MIATATEIGGSAVLFWLVIVLVILLILYFIRRL